MIHPFFICIILFPHFTLASFDYTFKVEKAHKAFLKLKINEGNDLISQAIQEDPNNGLAHLIANYGDVLTLLISENATLYTQLKDNESKRLKIISSLSSKSPSYLFSQAEIKLQWAVVKLKFGDELSSVWSIRQAFKMLEENNKKYPTFLPNKKSYGLLQAAFGSLPDTYASVASMAGLKGDFEQGMENLKEIASSNSPFAFESKLYLLFVENYILKKQDINFTQLQELHSENSDNLLLNFVYASLLIKNAYADKALAILNSRPQGNDYIDFPYLDFQTGEIYMYKGEYGQARGYYQKFLKEYKGSNFIKDTNYKLLLSYWLSNDEVMARAYFPKIQSEGKTVYDTDKYAQKFAQRGELPNKIIMKSRLFFDGGYYKESLETLNTFPISTSTNQKDIIEYYYRSGRLQHVNGNNTQAINFYQKTINLSQDVNFYFAPNSALQIGFIYKAQNKKDQAKTYFLKAMSYKDYEYKNSIDNKAKAALNELK